MLKIRKKNIAHLVELISKYKLLPPRGEYG